MKYDRSISVLIPYKPDGGYRDMNWSWIKRRYSRLMPDAEICIVYALYERYLGANGKADLMKALIDEK